MEMDQSCGTDEQWNFGGMIPPDINLNVQEVPRIEVNNGVLVLKSQQRKDDEPSDLDQLPGDSMVSFDVQPVI